MADAHLNKVARPGTAVRDKGQRRVEDVLDTALRVLIDDGYSQFTMRRVASAADMRLSNLQYYFSSKEDLLAALLNRTIDDYREALETISRKVRGRPDKRFSRIIQYLLIDQTRRESCLLFWELWALAGRDREIAGIMNRYYDTYIVEMANMILTISPDMPKMKAKRNAGVVVALIEGASLLRGAGKPRRAALAGFEKVIDAVCQSMAGHVPD